MTKNWLAYANHIIDTAKKLEAIQQRGDLTKDVVLYDAALRNLQTLSESTQHLPDYLKDQHPSIPWKQISGFRNILVHNYLGDIDAETVRKIIEQHLPPLVRVVKALLQEQKNDTH